MTQNYDVVVIGAGAAGMTAALTSALMGNSVLLLERSDQIGGTSSRAAGTLWIPGNPFMGKDQAIDDVVAARHYLNGLVGERSPAVMREAFLEQGPEMLSYLQQNTDIEFRPCPYHADYYPALEGSAAGSRPVEAAPFDGRRLSSNFDLVRPSLPEFMVLGKMMVSKADIDHLLGARKSLRSAIAALRLITRYAIDRVSWSRGTRLTMGNALCASLLYECLRNQVQLVTNAEIVDVNPMESGVHSIDMTVAGQAKRVSASRGVIFAGGGFSANAEQRVRNMPVPAPRNTTAWEGNDGSVQRLAYSLGAVEGPSVEHNAWWFPSSTVARKDGTQGIYPHIILDRAKPGVIAVKTDGTRFVNEGVSYHEFARAQYASGAIPCWLICDAGFVRRYGLGVVRPGGFGLSRALASGYLHSANTIADLAEKLSVPQSLLEESVLRMNSFAATGVDTEYGKGDDSLSRQNGDNTRNLPNPCLGTISKPPFYAVSLEPTDLGTSRGVVTDEAARVLDADGAVIPGLFACGNDMQSVMGGQYPAPGVTLGPGMTFAYVAAKTLSGDGPKG